MAETILELRNLVAGYGPVEVLHGVSVQVEAGEMVCVIGPNGAGKTTLLRAIFGLVDIRGGEVLLSGEDIGGLQTHRRISKGIAFIPQERSIFPSMTVQENLEMGASANAGKGHLDEMLGRVFQQFPVLEERRRQRAGTLSGGERKMLSVGIGLMSQPKVLLLDEPSLGLAPKVVQVLFSHIAEINASGTSIFLVEQNARRALAIANRGYVLELGQIKYQGTGQGLLNDREVQRLYLGGAA